jgi:hypothetical protein
LPGGLSVGGSAGLPGLGGGISGGSVGIYIIISLNAYNGSRAANVPDAFLDRALSAMAKDGEAHWNGLKRLRVDSVLLGPLPNFDPGDNPKEVGRLGRSPGLGPFCPARRGEAAWRAPLASCRHAADALRDVRSTPTHSLCQEETLTLSGL